MKHLIEKRKNATNWEFVFYDDSTRTIEVVTVPYSTIENTEKVNA